MDYVLGIYEPGSVMELEENCYEERGRGDDGSHQLFERDDRLPERSRDLTLQSYSQR